MVGISTSRPSVRPAGRAYTLVTPDHDTRDTGSQFKHRRAPVATCTIAVADNLPGSRSTLDANPARTTAPVASTSFLRPSTALRKRMSLYPKAVMPNISLSFPHARRDVDSAAEFNDKIAPAQLDRVSNTTLSARISASSRQHTGAATALEENLNVALSRYKSSMSRGTRITLYVGGVFVCYSQSTSFKRRTQTPTRNIGKRSSYRRAESVL